MEVNKESIIRLVIETWRFRRIFDRLLTKLEPNDQIRYQTQLTVVRQETRGISGAIRLAYC